MKTILKVLVGSRAHGLADDDSDYDFRGVFVSPTKSFFTLKPFGLPPKTTSWIEGGEDDTSYEIGHFLNLACTSNPSVLEVFHAPVIEFDDIGWGAILKSYFKYVWTPKLVAESCIGYGLNQRKKFLDGKDNRPAKYAVSYLRVLLQGFHLLRDHEFVIDFSKNEYFDRLKRWRRGEFTKGEVIDVCALYEENLRRLVSSCSQQPDFSKVQELLYEIREDFWDGKEETE